MLLSHLRTSPIRMNKPTGPPCRSKADRSASSAAPFQHEPFVCLMPSGTASLRIHTGKLDTQLEPVYGTGPRAGTPDLNRPAVFKTCQTKIFGIAAPTRNPRSPEGKPKKQADQPGPRCVKPNTWFEYVSHASAQRRTTVTTNSSSQCQTAVHKSTKRIICLEWPATRSPQGEGWWSRTGSNQLSYRPDKPPAFLFAPSGAGRPHPWPWLASLTLRGAP